ncbi:MAG: helix-turn-helix domain-containing protein [Thermomicrobiales bacterium]|nr:helix-turn-helix domain-containing protein [Thermomicrobiales bacterium]
MSTTYPDILTPDQAAEYLQVNRETIYRYIRDGRLNASRIGRTYRIRKQSLDLLLATSSTRPDIQLRTYTDQQLAEFLEQDQLDAEASEVVREWENIEASIGVHESR